MVQILMVQILMVQILLSTYNGEKYLAALLDSLLAQEYSDIQILARDDGSEDGTLAILEQYAAAHKHLQVIRGERLGFAKSFLRLLELSSPDADYVAFCDQDDVWLPRKVARAVEVLQSYPGEMPLMYSARRCIVDENLQPIKYSPLPAKGLSFRNALVQCVTPGCVVTLNRAARELIRRKMPQYAISHDWWSYLVISSLGTMVYDPQPNLLYRKHDSNVVGVSRTKVEVWRRGLLRFRKYGKQQIVRKQAEEFQRTYGALLSEGHRKVLERFLTSRQKLISRLRYALSCDVYRYSSSQQFILRVLLALNRL